MSTIVAFTADQVARLTGLTDSQLSVWDKTGFFPPTYAPEYRGEPYGRIYSFREVVGLRTIALLRNRHHLPIQELRKTGAWLAERFQDPWKPLTFYVHGQHVYFADPDTGDRLAGRAPLETVLLIETEKIAQEVEARAAELLARRSDEVGVIQQSRSILGNTPVLAGTRISTRSIWNPHHAGYSTRRIVQEYPSLTPADVEAAIAFEERHPQRLTG